MRWPVSLTLRVPFTSARAMRTAYLPVIAMGCVVVVLLITASAGSRAWAVESSPPTQGFGAGLATDSPVYRPGQPILITFEVFNHTSVPVRLDFNSGQRYDFVIEDNGGNEIWRWSAGKMFTMAMGQEELGPGNSRLIYEIEYAARLKPGQYKVIGILTDARRQTSATISVDVE